MWSRVKAVGKRQQKLAMHRVEVQPLNTKSILNVTAEQKELRSLRTKVQTVVLIRVNYQHRLRSRLTRNAASLYVRCMFVSMKCDGEKVVC